MAQANNGMNPTRSRVASLSVRMLLRAGYTERWALH